jgi:polyferredoxin
MKKEDIVRYVILGFFFILFTVFSWRHFILGGGAAASVDALCPFGGFETLYTFISTGGFVPRILVSSLILAIGILIATLVMRKGFCGYVCPFGTLQEIVGKFKKSRLKLNKKLDRKARYIKYVILATILVGTAITSTLVFRNYDPFMTFFHFGKGIFWDFSPDEFIEHIIPFIILIAVIIGSLFIDRIWCRYLCPLTATMSVFAFFGLNRIERNKRTCIDCKLCDKKCPMDVEVSTADEVEDLECINCNQCVNVCPKNSLSNRILSKEIKPITYAIVVIILFFSAVVAAKAFGIWQSVPTTSLVSLGGELTGDNIKGWMSLDDVSREAGISLHHFLEDLNLPDNVDTSLPLKDIGKTYGIDFETSEVREYVNNFEHNPAHHQESQKTTITTETACPWNLVNDPAPGKCGLYADKNNDRICDYSQ